MKIEHIAIWTTDLEEMRSFYMKYFSMQSNNKYENKTKQFTSYFLSFNSGQCRIELMHSPNIVKVLKDTGMNEGLTHFAIAVGSKEKVDEITETLRKDGFTIASEPRITGDGYYESLVLDPDGNRVEITE